MLPLGNPVLVLVLIIEHVYRMGSAKKRFEDIPSRF